MNRKFRTNAVKLAALFGIVMIVATACPPSSGTGGGTTAPTSIVSTTVAPSTTVTPTTAAPTTTVASTTTTTTTVPTPPAPNLIPNPGFQLGTGNQITSWSDGSYGTMTRALTATSDARSGGRAANVAVTSRTDGDAKWVYDTINVTPGATYTYTDWYKSSVATSLDALFINSAGQKSFTWLGEPGATASWTKSVAYITVPAGAVKMAVYHSISSVGSMQLDDTSLTLGVDKFNRALVSIEFDDGFTNAHTLGLPIVKSFGYVPTMNVITDTVANNATYGTGTYMTANQLTSWRDQGGKVGCHTVTHSILTSLSQAGVTSELTNCKNYLTNLLGTAPTTFVTPECVSNATVVAVAKSLFSSLRNCDSPTNFKTEFDAFNLRSLNVLSTRTDAELAAILTAAKANKGWTIVVYHKVSTTSDLYTVSPATLERHMKIIQDSGISVVPTETALNEVLTQVG